ncbi:MAG TPA: hypothetical protein VMT85_17510 [Thermoanaerobaculia bacterium]|nr:hypothetical protein [Thermoanaerobaculia bacterium]
MPKHARLSFIGLSLLLAAPFWLPLWQTRMEAPQYRGDEALEVSVYAGKVHGDLKEIDNLNQYVGVELPLGGVELRILPLVLGALSALALLGALAPSRWQRPLAALLLTLLVSASAGGLAVLQYRLYQMGHQRGEQIMEGVEDFTPPVLGHIHVANFDAWTRLGAGGWLLVVAVALCAAMVFRLPVAGRPLLTSAVSGGPA